MEHYYRELLSFLSTRMGNRHMAEDVAHDAYVRMLERSGTDVIVQPRAFLYRTALNLVVDDHRRSVIRRSEPLEALDSEEQTFVPSPQTTMDQGQRLEMLQRALSELPVLCRESFMLRKLEGMSHPEISEQLGISRSLVEKHIVNAMKHCRARMRQWDQG